MGHDLILLFTTFLISHLYQTIYLLKFCIPNLNLDAEISYRISKILKQNQNLMNVCGKSVDQMFSNPGIYDDLTDEVKYNPEKYFSGLFYMQFLDNFPKIVHNLVFLITIVEDLFLCSLLLFYRDDITHPEWFYSIFLGTWISEYFYGFILITISIIILLLCCVFPFITLYYFNHKSYIPPISFDKLAVFSVSIVYIPSIRLLASAAGRYLHSFISLKEYFFAVVFSVIGTSYLLSTIYFCFYKMFEPSTVFFKKDPFFSFSPTGNLYHHVGQSIFYFMSHLVLEYHPLIFIYSHVVYSLIGVVLTGYFFYAKKHYTIFSPCLFLTMVFSDLIFLYGGVVMFHYNILLQIGFLLVSYVCYTFIFNKYMIIAYNNGKPRKLHHAVKCLYFYLYGLDIDLNIILDYMTKSDIDVDRLFLVTRLCSFFPQYYQRYKDLMTRVYSFRIRFSTVQSYSYYCLKSLEFIRGGSTDEEFKLQELRVCQSNIYTEIRDVWTRLMAERPFFAFNQNEINLLDNKITCSKRLLEKYSLYLSNNPIFTKDYSEYLLENYVEFEEGAKWAFITKTLINGTKCSHDASRMSFIILYPKFFEQVMNESGVICIGDINSNRLVNDITEVVSSLQIRMRLQKVLNSIRPKYVYIFVILSCFKLLVFSVLLLFLYTNFVRNFKENEGTVFMFYELVTGSNDILMASLLNVCEIVTNYIGTFNYSRIFSDFPQNETYSVFWNTNLTLHAIAHAEMALDIFHLLVLNLLHHRDRFNTNVSLELLTRYNLSFTGFSLDNQTNTYKDYFYGYFSIRRGCNSLAERIIFICDNSTDAYINNFDIFLDIRFNMNKIVDFTYYFLNQICEFNSQVYDNNVSTSLILVASVSCAILILFAITYVLLIYKHTVYNSRIHAALKKYPNESLVRMNKHIIVHPKFQANGPKLNLYESFMKGNILYVMIVFSMLLVILEVLIILFEFLLFRKSMLDISSLENLFGISLCRYISAADAITGITSYSAFLTNPSLDSSTKDEIYSRIIGTKETYDFFTTLFSKLELDIDKSLMDQLFALTLVDQCKSSEYEELGHGYYQCLSIDSGAIYYSRMLYEIIDDINSTDLLGSNTYIQTFHFLFVHLLIGFEELSSFLYNVSETNNSKSKLSFITLIFIGFVLLIVTVLYDIYCFYKIESILETFNRLLLRINPHELVDNKELLEHLLNKEILYDKQLDELSSVILFSRFMIVLSDSNFQITHVNDAFTSSTGYELSTIYKYDINFFFEDEIYIQSYLKYRKKTMETFKTIIVKEDQSKMLCNATVIPILNDKYNLDRIVIVFEDITEVEKLKEDIENLKIKNRDNLNTSNKELLTTLNSSNNNQTAGIYIFIRVSGHIMNESLEELFNEALKLFSKIDNIMKGFNFIKIGVYNSSYVACSMPKIEYLGTECINAINFAHKILEVSTLPTFIGISYGSGVSIHYTETAPKKLYLNGPPIMEAEKLSYITDARTLSISQGIYNIIGGNCFNFQTKESKNFGIYYNVFEY